MGLDRSAGPDRADFGGGAVADGDHGVDPRGGSGGEFIPGFRAQAVDGMAMGFQGFQRHWMRLALGLRAGRVALQPALTERGDEDFAQDGAGGIAGAEDEDVQHDNVRVRGDLPLTRTRLHFNIQ